MNWLVAPFSWILTAPARWLGRARGFLGWSLPMRVAVLLALFLGLCVVGYYVASLWLADNAVADPKTDPRFILSWLVLLVTIPVAAFFAVRSWLESEPTQFPDIDEAWRQGLAAVGRAGIELDQCPLFLATGVSSPLAADNLMQATDWDLLVDGKPDGKSPLRWYASRDNIIVFLLDASATSMLQGQVEQASESAPVASPGWARGTLMGPGGSGAGPAAAPATGIRGTIIAGAPTGTPASRPPTAPATGIRGTMLAGQGAHEVGTTTAPAMVNLDRKMVAEQADRLARVCRLAAESRQPLCPINGSIAIIDWKTLLSAPAGQLPTVIREDSTRMIEASQMHAPMAIFIKGMDDETGFVELTRRVGENRARENRFGHGFNHQAPLDASQLEALARNSCGAFEDWIYDLFRHPDALGRTNNDKLYALLCKMRNEVQPKVVELVSSLSGACVPSGGRGPLLCGCYFGAAGGSRMRQAFVRSVFDKLGELDEDLEWSEDAWKKEFNFQSMVRSMLVINAFLLLAIVGLLVYYFFFTSS
ncbi:hypothetical protein [Aureliella helgolandensis]|uniref:Type VI secretion system component TssM1 N-terminal domain-containing protein n=1 Tax=Aureliella helgolandensis TaxID=2527968 RepID=A0A518GAH5_9BACT|nr:hypothetical protein [Aureliella helgolandensis]QDV25563.1 hypothetical protein Q31a_38890 [Aureliella helgolandensis]